MGDLVYDRQWLNEYIGAIGDQKDLARKMRKHLEAAQRSGDPDEAGKISLIGSETEKLEREFSVLREALEHFEYLLQRSAAEKEDAEISGMLDQIFR